MAAGNLLGARLLGGVAGQLLGASMDGGGPAPSSDVRGQLLAATVTPGATARGQLLAASVRAAGMTIEIGPPGVGNAFDTCQVLGVSLTDGLTPDQWLWRVVSVAPPLPAGQSITLVGSGNRVQYIAPATRDGCTITFEGVGRKAGLPDSSDTVQQTITAHGWEWTGPGLTKPVRGPLIPGTGGGSGVQPDTLTDVLSDTL